MGKKKRAAEEAAELEIQAMSETLMEFEEWFSLREEKIPAHHHREIIKADFKARKVPNKATLEQFDAALKQYGLTLK